MTDRFKPGTYRMRGGGAATVFTVDGGQLWGKYSLPGHSGSYSGGWRMDGRTYVDEESDFDLLPPEAPTGL